MILRFALIVLLLIPTMGEAKELSIFTEELPPLNYYDTETKKAGGFSVCIVEELLARTGIKPVGGKINVYPWARAMKIIEKEPNTMLFSMTKTRARASKFKWVGPIAGRSVWLWKLKERTDIQLGSLVDAKKYRIGGIYEFAISKYLQEQGFKVDMVNGVYQNWKKLITHRIDLGTAMEIEAVYYMKRFGKSLDQLEKIAKVDDRYQFYIALNKDTSDELVNRLQAALDEMKSDGTYDRIKDAFLR